MGKSQLRAKLRVLISPTRPVVVNPTFDEKLVMKKEVGLVGSKPANLVVTFQKSFYLAGETAYFGIYLDNSNCKDNCTIEIAHKTKIQQISRWRNYSSTITNRVEKFTGAAGGEAAKTFFVPF